MFWSTNKSTTTTYNYPSTGSTSTVVVTGGGGSGSSGYTASGGGTVTIPSIGVGSTGSVLGTSGWISNYGPTNKNVSLSGTIVIDADEPIIKTNKNTINLDDLYENLKIINEMFRVIIPNRKKMLKYPTLADAYEEYVRCKHVEPEYRSEEFIAAYNQYLVLDSMLEEEKE